MHLSGAEIAAAQGLGFPWDRLADAVGAREDAERAALHALESGGPDAARAAGFELETALLAERRCRGDLADALLLMLQAAIDERFTELWGKVLGFAVRAEWRKEVERFYSTQAGGLTWALNMEQRLEEQQAEIRKLQAETWALANALALAEQRIHDGERATDGSAHDRPSEAAAERGGRGAARGREGDRREAG